MLAAHQLKLSKRWRKWWNKNMKHGRKSTTEQTQKKKARLLERPSQSPDLNPWRFWSDHTRRPTDVSELKRFWKKNMLQI